jgi:N-acetylglutamate synthase-like GNAT family acetyltransferase
VAISSQGVATRLVDAAGTLAKTLGHESIFIAVRDGQSAYERRGWTVVDTVEIEAVTWMVMSLCVDQDQQRCSI